MKLFLDYINLILIILILSITVGCQNIDKHPKLNDANKIIMTRSLLNSDSVTRFYYYTLEIDQSTQRFIYNIDSIFEVETQTCSKKTDKYFYNHSIQFLMTDNKDSLHLMEYNEKNELSSINSYLKQAVINICLESNKFNIWKFSVQDSNIYGNETIFFSDKLGFIESFNKAADLKIQLVEIPTLCQSDLQKIKDNINRR